jgi:carbon monoxide dehydrogenase subunit G
MNMTGTGKVSINAPLELVWRYLMDPDVLAKCIMGCEKLESVGERKYHADLSIGIASVKGRYDASIELKDVREFKGYRLIVHGEGAPGFVEAEGIIDLVADEDGVTTLSYEYTANVGGKVAAVGQRMLGGVAKLLIGDFFKKIKRQIDQAERTTA